jgi:hypothetical protein
VLRKSTSSGILALALVTTMSGCGGDGGNGSGSGSSRLSADIDGASWSADPTVLNLVGVPYAQPGTYTLVGSNRAVTQTLSITLYNIREAGVYPLGVGVSVPGGSGLVSDQTGGWATIQSGDAGTIDITTLTDSRMAGTFNFVAEALSGTATGTVEVTNGEFDLAVKPNGTVPPLPDYAGSTLNATFNGEPFTAANVMAADPRLTQGIFTLVGDNSGFGVAFSVASVTGPGTYELSSPSTIGVTGDGSDPTVCCWNSNPGGSGSVTVTSMTATRIQGTFTATLLPTFGSELTGEMMVEGSFDAGFPFSQ